MLESIVDAIVRLVFGAVMATQLTMTARLNVLTTPIVLFSVGQMLKLVESV